MNELVGFPYLVFAFSLLLLSTSAGFGFIAKSRQRFRNEAERVDLGIVLNATLALLGLIIGFSFSMAITRYDQRNSLEEEEANAIGTEYLRVDLLGNIDQSAIRALLKSYLNARISFYLNADRARLKQISADTQHVELQLWAAVRDTGAAHPTPITALAISGMNDVINAEGYTQAAWSNRIPIPAWSLLGAIAMCSNLLIGYGMQTAKLKPLMLFVLPVIVSVSFFLIADIDSPRGGLIQVQPRSLLNLNESLLGR